MRKYINYLLVLFLVSSCTSDTEAEPQALETSTTTSSTTTSSTTTTVQKIDEDIVVDEFGIELLEVSPEMKQQFDELIAFVEKRTGLTYSEYPKFNLYTLEGLQRL